MRTAELVAIDERRLLRRLDELAQRGALPGGGRYRALYTPAWVSATELVSGWMKEAGLLVRRDAGGNVWGRGGGSRGGCAFRSGLAPPHGRRRGAPPPGGRQPSPGPGGAPRG